MAAEIATLERVRAAVDELHAEGNRATADAVIRKIGGGSKPTVLRHMRTLREVKDAPVEPLPSSVFERVKPGLAEIYAAGAASAEARLNDRIERFHRIMADLESQIEELAAANAKQEKQITSLVSELAGRNHLLVELGEKLERREDELEEVRDQLAGLLRDKDDAIAGRIEAFAARFEELSSKLAAAGSVTPARKEDGSQ